MKEKIIFVIVVVVSIIFAFNFKRTKDNKTFSTTSVKVKFPGTLFFLGFGSVGQGLLPLVIKHLDVSPSQIRIHTGDSRGEEIAEKYGVKEFIKEPLYKKTLTEKMNEKKLKKGDILINVSVNIDSIYLYKWCQENGIHYIDTSLEPWGFDKDEKEAVVAADEKLYDYHELIKKMKKKSKNLPTSLVAIGANPGLVNILIKKALINLSDDKLNVPKTRREWGELAKSLGVKVIHIAERDSQVGKKRKKDKIFVNTWSIDGFVWEACQHAELGWGTHEKSLPEEGARFTHGSNTSIYIKTPGYATKVRTWVPSYGQQDGYLICHYEAITMADYFTLRDENNTIVYTPTVNFAYHPSPDAKLSLDEYVARDFRFDGRLILSQDDIIDGMDELGVLVMTDKLTYWYGSQLTNKQAKELIPYNSATTLQISSTLLAGIIYIIENPKLGLLEPDDILDYKRILDIAGPYLGTLKGYKTDWNPLKDRHPSHECEEIDESDPLQFKNFIYCF